MRTLLVVCGYSHPEDQEINPICLARVRGAERYAAGSDAVLLSGGSKRGGVLSEAELMAHAWQGDLSLLRYDRESQLTAENACAAVEFALSGGYERIDVLTSWWHMPRTWLLFTLIAAGSGLSLRAHGCRSPWSLRLLAGEIRSVYWLPAQIWRARQLWRAKLAQQPA